MLLLLSLISSLWIRIDSNTVNRIEKLLYQVLVCADAASGVDVHAY